MSQKTVTLQLASAVATNGTFTVSYPSGTTKGNFINGANHTMWAMQTNMKVGRDFTLSLGNTSATVTYIGTTTLPAGSTVIFGFDTTGAGVLDQPVILRSRDASLMMIELGSPILADADGACASQSVAAGAAAVFDGALLSSEYPGQIVFDVPRNVVGAWTTASVITFKGYDEYGNYMVEKSASGTSHTGSKAFKRLTEVSSSASITSATFGTGSKLGLPVFLRDTDQIVASYENAVKVDAGGRKHYIPFEIEQTELLAGTAEQIVCPVAGRITKYRGIVQGAVTTGGAVKLQIGGVDVTGGTFTIADADAAGVKYAATPSAANTVAVADSITVVPAAAIDTAGQLNGIIEITQDGVNDGNTWVVGSQAAATGTSGDVRGTFTPATTMDGVVSFAFLVAVDNPSYLGAPQYAG
jgi:hypothetical protein